MRKCQLMSVFSVKFICLIFLFSWGYNIVFYYIFSRNNSTLKFIVINCIFSTFVFSCQNNFSLNKNTKFAESKVYLL